MRKYQTNNLFEEKVEEPPCNNIIRVALETAADTEFDYAVPDNLWPVQIGQRVEVPFGKNNKHQQGFCVEIVPEEQSFKGFKLKKVSKIIDKEPLIDSQLMELAKWISSYYVCPLGQVLAAIVPSAVKKSAGVKTQNNVYLNIKENEFEQEIEKLRGKKQKQILAFLKEQEALNKYSAIELQELLSKVDCGKEPLKRLAEKNLIKTIQTKYLKSLPAIPEAIFVKSKANITLNPDQQKALEFIKAQIASEKFGVTLIYGVTDSGKTELYIRAIQAVIEKGKSAIILLPEIALTAQ